MTDKSQKAAVLSIAGHDPTGGAGIIADTEVFIQHQCQPCTIITCLTVQDSNTVHKLIPVTASDIIEQAEVLFSDINIAAIKIGLTASVACVKAVVKILQLHPSIPVVFDPVLASGDGTALANDELINTLINDLLPLVSVLTPNTLEAAKLSQLALNQPIETHALKLLNYGVKHVLITGGHLSTKEVINQYFAKQQLIQQYSWPRQPGQFHGTGCTLSAAIAALIAKGLAIDTAIAQAQAYTDASIQKALQVAKGQAFPNRLLSH